MYNVLTSLSCLRFLIAVVTTVAASVSLSAAENSESWRTDLARRKENRPPELWRSYMHGVADFFATPLDVSFQKATPEPATIDDHFKPATDVPAFVVPAGKTFTSESLPLDVSALRGKAVRFFYWMRGENIGRNPTPNSYHDAPQMYVIVKDARGRQLSKIISHNGAIGSYPWHGYYRDIQVPAAAEAIHFQIENLHRGTAWFGRFGYEIVTEQNSYATNEKQDPDTGSLAAFPWYEPINFHFFAKPPASQHTWNFLRGPAAGMIGQPYDLTTLNGLRRYFAESVKTDLDQMNHGIMYFSSRYHFAKEAGVLPPMEDGWLAEVARLVISDQNPETGYWGTAGIPQSMSVTFHFVDMLFAFGLERTDAPGRPDPKRCISDSLPHAEQMVRTTLKLQSTVPGTKGGALAAWSSAAYNFTDRPDGSRNRCQLGSSMNAIRLLRIARRFVDRDFQAQIDASVEAAFRYMLETVITPEGLWRQTDTDRAPSKPAYWANIVDYSRYLEPRTDASLAAPRIERLTPDTLRCTAWEGRQNSIRIYLSGTNKGLSPEKIVGIISSGDAKVIQLDPYLAVRRMAEAAKDNWGVKAFGGYNSYTYNKVFRQLPKTFPASVGDAELKLAPPTLSALTSGARRLYATAVDWYGVESPPVEL